MVTAVNKVHQQTMEHIKPEMLLESARRDGKTVNSTESVSPRARLPVHLLKS